MVPFEALYGKLYKMSICWDDVGEMIVNKVKIIQDRLKAIRDRHKSYVDVRRKGLEFGVCDWGFS